MLDTGPNQHHNPGPPLSMDLTQSSLPLSLPHPQHPALTLLIYNPSLIPQPQTNLSLHFPSPSLLIHHEPVAVTSITQPSSISPPTPRRKKRFRTEIGKLGINLRQKLLCGLFTCELTGYLHYWDLDYSNLSTSIDDSPPSSTFHNNGGILSQGLREAVPNQLPQVPWGF